MKNYSETHLQVLRLLQSNPLLSQREMANALGVSLGKTNYCIKALIEKGHIKVQNFLGSHNKLAYSYLLTPTGIKEKAQLTAGFLKRKVQEYELLRTEIETLRLEVIETSPPSH